MATPLRFSVRSLSVASLLGIALALGGCAAEGSSYAGDDDVAILEDGKLDSFRNPTELGTLEMGTPMAVELKRDQRFLSLGFELSGDAYVKIETNGREAISNELDTVMYLYKQGADGEWGRYIAKNDDADDDTLHLLSRIERELGAGKYRIIIRGGTATDLGRFNVELTCAGDGCLAASSCVFGEYFGNVEEEDHLEVTHRRVTRSRDLSALERQQLVRAMNDNGDDDVHNADAALRLADSNEVNVYQIKVSEDGREFTALEYGRGDNSYGAIFLASTLDRVSLIQDGENAECTAPRTISTSCILGDPSVRQVSQRTIEHASDANDLEAMQIVLAMHESTHDDVRTVAEALEAADSGEIDIIELRAPDGREFTSIEYGAGDNTYGAIFAKGFTARAAAIHDGDIEECLALGDTSSLPLCNDGPALCEIIAPRCAPDTTLGTTHGCFQCISPLACR